MTSAITFYQSPVEIKHVRIGHNRRSNDAISFIRSDFSIEHSVFEDSERDALNADFCKGRIADSAFANCGGRGGNGDCLDIAGTALELENVDINKASGKGLSVGAGSSMTGKNIKIMGTHIGIAGKDASEIHFENVQLEDNEVGIAAYEKSPEFAPSKITINRLQSKTGGHPYFVEEGSELTIDGKIVPTDLKEFPKIFQ